LWYLLGQVTWDGTVNDKLSSIENAVGSSRNDALYGDAAQCAGRRPGGADFISGDAGSDTVSYANSSTGVIMT